MGALPRNISALTGDPTKSGSACDCTSVVALPEFCMTAFRASVSLFSCSTPAEHQSFINSSSYASYQPIKPLIKNVCAGMLSINVDGLSGSRAT